jgi:transcriptional regulator with XRE-family HTH domain
MSEEVSGDQIKALRLAAGLDVAVLARRVSLSRAQLLQIENDQHSLFYSPAIRRHAARKVWAHLIDHHGLEAQPGTSMVPAQPEPPVLAMPPSAIVLADSPAPLLDLPIQDLSDQRPPAQELPRPARGATPEFVHEPVHEPVHQPLMAQAHRHSPLHRRAGAPVWWMGLCLAAAGLTVWALIKRPPSLSAAPALYGSVSPNAAAAEPPAGGPADVRPQRPAALPASEASLKPVQEGDWVALAPASAQRPVSSPVAALSVRSPVTADCPDLTGPTPPALDLPPGLAQARSLQLASSVAQVVCVLDGAGKLQALRLEPDQARAIAGPAPWTVQAGSLQNLQLSSEGRRLLLPTGGSDRVQLAEPR